MRTTVFFKGCPLHCVWCQNPETIDGTPHLEWTGSKCLHCRDCMEACPRGALEVSAGFDWHREKCLRCGECVRACPSKALEMVGVEISADELMRKIEKDSVFFKNSGGGVTFSGGEPLLQSEFLGEACRRCRHAGINVAIDSSGAVPIEKILEILPVTDYLLWDIKTVDAAVHREYTGVSNELILSNLSSILKRKSAELPEIWIRTPLIPKLTATEDNIIDIASFLKKIDNPALKIWELCAFNNLCAERYAKMDRDWQLADVPLLTNSELENFYEIAKGVGGDRLEVRTAGITRKDAVS